MTPRPQKRPISLLAGWRKLPAELKIQVLSDALPYQKKFRSSAFKKPQDEFNDDAKLFNTRVLPLLACPEISDLALEIFYAQNIMVIADREALPRHVIEYVKRIKITFQERSFQLWFNRELVSGGSLEFSNLHLLNLTIDGTRARYDILRTKWSWFTKVHVQNRTLKITFQHPQAQGDGPYSNIITYIAPPINEIDNVILNSVSATWNGKESKERWLRYYYYDTETMKPIKFVNGGQWTESDADMGSYARRATTRIVWF